MAHCSGNQLVGNAMPPHAAHAQRSGRQKRRRGLQEPIHRCMLSLCSRSICTAIDTLQVALAGGQSNRARQPGAPAGLQGSGHPRGIFSKLAGCNYCLCGSDRVAAQPVQNPAAARTAPHQCISAHLVDFGSACAGMALLRPALLHHPNHVFLPPCHRAAASAAWRQRRP